MSLAQRSTATPPLRPTPNAIRSERDTGRTKAERPMDNIISTLTGTSQHDTEGTASMELDDPITDDERSEDDYESPLTSQLNGLGLSPRSLKKSSFRTRWLVLVLCCILMSSNYYA
jgi:hypothetical protein